MGMRELGRWRMELKATSHITAFCEFGTFRPSYSLMSSLVYTTTTIVIIYINP
jgi:hypothetical protein